MTIEQLYINAISIDLNALRDETLKEIDNIIIDTITNKQLQLGIDGNGANLPTYVQGKYSDYKNTKNPKSGGRYDYKDTGDFYEGMFQGVTGEAVVVNSKDFKNEFIKEHGYNVFGLTEDNFKDVSENEAIPLFISKFKKALGIE
jgi:hypothetical protein